MTPARRDARDVPGREREVRVSGFHWERHPIGPFAS